MNASHFQSYNVLTSNFTKSRFPCTGDAVLLYVYIHVYIGAKAASLKERCFGCH